MRIEPMGDAAYLLRDLGPEPFRLAEWLNRVKPPGLLEANASYETVGLYVDPEVFDFGSLEGYKDLQDQEAPEILHEIPVCFALGEDLETSAKELGLDPLRLIESFCGTSLRCFAIGFCPGFPYLGYLPTELQGLSRLETPRTRVSAGSVAVTRDQAGIYPIDHPGGWKILGRTPLSLADPATDYYPISAGHLVRFFAIDRAEFDARRGERL